MKAKLNWIPYSNKIAQGKLQHDIDFERIELKKSGITGSDSLGRYKVLKFKFSEITIKALLIYIEKYILKREV